MKGRVMMGCRDTDDWRVFRCHHPIWRGVDSDRLSDIICDLLEPLQQPSSLPLSEPSQGVILWTGQVGGATKLHSPSSGVFLVTRIWCVK